MSARTTWRLVHVHRINREGDTTYVDHDYGRSAIVGSSALLPVLGALAEDELPQDHVTALVAMAALEFPGTTGETVLVQLSRTLAQLPMLVERAVYDDERLLVRMRPIAEGAAHLEPDAISTAGRLQLSRFAHLRVRPGEPGLSLASPLSLHRAQIGPELLGALDAAAREGIVLESADDARTGALRLLGAAGFLVPEGSEAADPRLSTWSFHDLVFHATSRPGRSDDPFGAYFAHLDQPAPPALVEREGPRVSLPVPDFDDVVARDLRLTEAIESRHSVRTYAENPPSLAELAELLWRCQRVRSLSAIEDVDFPMLSRLYPTGGMCADLELHLVVARVDGLEPGLYAYDATSHELVREGELVGAVRLLADARAAAGGTLEPPVLMVITSRFARISWKYERIAYALTLKHVGVLVQTIYLVATSMGLGACSLGSGNPTAAATAFGLDWLIESSVGEIAVGRERLVTPTELPDSWKIPLGPLSSERNAPQA